jgi:hypothetical protein
MLVEKLAIIELEAVVDSAERYQKAEEIRANYLKGKIHLSSSDLYQADRQYRDALRDPELVQFDERRDEVKDHLIALKERGYQILFLSARPETMREPLLDLLNDEENEAGDEEDEAFYTGAVADAGVACWLVLQPSTFSEHQVVDNEFAWDKTWLAGTVGLLVSLFQPAIMLFISEDEAQRLMVEDIAELAEDMNYFASDLASAVELLASEDASPSLES